MKCDSHPEAEAAGTCSACGKAVCADCSVVANGATMCKACAVKASAPSAMPSAPPVATRKEPFFSLVLSFIGMFFIGFIGLGQIYNGQVKKGLILTLGNWVLGFGTASIYVLGMFTIVGIVCCLPVLLVPLLLWFYALYDAYETAEMINRGETVKDWLD